ncbi:MAG TPA: hypothetical protein PLX89_04150 [Verrucomicrobiota bacterium]|nr:hypothetical protein [Verrucomicrobiales bacterium]HRI12176.1 hypothetical protein [Verrucomicrobiota bacterium]
MKHIRTFLLIGLIRLFMGVPTAAVPPLPIVEDTEVVALTLGEGGKTILECIAFAHRSSNPLVEYYTVFFELVWTNTGRPLRVNPTRIDFEPGEVVSGNNLDYLDQYGDNRLTLVIFDQQFIGEWVYLDIGSEAPPTSFYNALRQRTQFLLGFAFEDQDGIHYGWAEFTRPDTIFTTGFDLTASAWNPLPGEPIMAGTVPSAVRLVSQLTDQGLRLTWAAAASILLLEYADELRPEAQWQILREVVGTEIILPPPERTRFYRIRKP